MKKIGLIGWTAPESTIMYYKKLTHELNEMNGGEKLPEITIESVDMYNILNQIGNRNCEEASDYMVERIKYLKNGGAEIISFTSVTMHILLDHIYKKTDIELESIPKAVCEKAVSKGIKKVGLLGTGFTMKENHMKKDFIKEGIEVFVPDEKGQELIDNKIFEELVHGTINESTVKEFVNIIEEMKNKYGIEAIILGCTEIPLIINDDNSPVPVLNATEIHINKLIKMAMD